MRRLDLGASVERASAQSFSARASVCRIPSRRRTRQPGSGSLTDVRTRRASSVCDPLFTPVVSASGRTSSSGPVGFGFTPMSCSRVPGSRSSLTAASGTRARSTGPCPNKIASTGFRSSRQTLIEMSESRLLWRQTAGMCEGSGNTRIRRSWRRSSSRSSADVHQHRAPPHEPTGAA